MIYPPAYQGYPAGYDVAHLPASKGGGMPRFFGVRPLELGAHSDAAVGTNGGIATVDRDGRAGDELRLVAGEESDEVGDFLRLADAPCRVQVCVLFEGRLVDEGGADDARGDCVHTDALLRVHRPGGAGHVHDAALRRPSKRCCSRRPRVRTSKQD